MALTKYDRAQTVIRAAKDLHMRTRAAVVSVRLELDTRLARSGNALARAKYSPDGGGNSGKEQGQVWEVWASWAQFTQQEIEIVVAWQEKYDEYEVELGGRETKLIAALVEQFGVPESAITTPQLKVIKTTERIPYHEALVSKKAQAF